MIPISEYAVKSLIFYKRLNDVRAVADANSPSRDAM